MSSRDIPFSVGQAVHDLAADAANHRTQELTPRFPEALRRDGCRTV